MTQSIKQLEVRHLSNAGYVGVLCKSKDDRFLLVQRRKESAPYGEYWSIPSMRREPLQSAIDCALLAFKRDTTVSISHKHHLRYITNVMHDGGLYYTYLYSVDKPFRIWADGRKYLDFKWFTYEELPENTTPEVLYTINLSLQYDKA